MASSNKNKPVASIRKSMITGSLWMMAMRWSIRGIGLVSTIILARLLVPEDFGVVAMSMILVGLIEAISTAGVDLALIRNADAKRKHYDTAWTFRLLQAIFVSVMLLLLAPVIAQYFNEPRVVEVIRLLAIGALASGFENIGTVAFRKELDFRREFHFRVLKKTLTFTVTIILALVLESYWALVIGIVSGRILEVVLSYLMHPYRPKVCFKASRELWSFSQWMLITNMGSYVQRKIDEIIVGGTSSTASMGTYNIATEVSKLPATELVVPITGALFSGYSKLANEPKRLLKAYTNVLGFVFLVTIPAAFGVGVVAEDLVLVLLGEKWIAAIPLIKWLAILGTVNAIAITANNLFIVIGKERLLAILIWVQIGLIAPLLFLAASQAGIEGIAMARAAFSLVFIFVIFGVLSRVADIDLKSIVGLVWRPLISSLAMVIAIIRLHPDSIGSPFVSLIFDVALGVVVFALTLYSLWYFSGKKDGAEKSIMEFVQKKFAMAKGT